MGQRKFLLSAIVLGACLRAIVDYRVAAAPPQLPMSGAWGFLGQRCAQGDRTKRCSISANGRLFSLTNELGSTSSGNLQGMNSNPITVLNGSSCRHAELRRQEHQSVERNVSDTVRQWWRRRW
jgi:hypothetical protein